MAKRERICPQCDRQFGYEIGQGKDRRYCGIECQRLAILARRKAETAKLKCFVEGCLNSPRAIGSKICEMHYGRLRRNGTLECIPPSPLLEHSEGYLLVYAPDHPLSRGQVRVYEHRKVFYDAYGEGPFRCHVCDGGVTWSDMHVDHLDDDKHNNTITNLRPACPQCNQWRGKDRRVVSGQANAKPVAAFGEDQTVAEWSRRYGVPRTTIKRRLDDGWQAERAIATPPGPTGRKAERMGAH